MDLFSDFNLVVEDSSLGLSVLVVLSSSATFS